MNASLPRHAASISYLLRWCGRVSGVLLFASWVGFVVAEQFRDAPTTLHGIPYLQVCALAVVFAGYAIGWRSELAGGLLTLFGTAAFFAVHTITLSVSPSLAAAWFAAPGALFLLAWLLDYRIGSAKPTCRMTWDRRHSGGHFLKRLRTRAARRVTRGRAGVPWR
jgi:hypothetical protein